MPSIDIDRDAAHQAAQAELDKPIYTKASAGQQFIDWINELLYRLLQKTSSVPGGWLTTTVLLTLFVVAVIVVIHIARRTMRTKRGGDYALFEAAQLTAAQHRATAQGYAAEGNWTAAIRHRLRAVARQLGQVAHLAAELTQAATAFNDVTYGEVPGTQVAYQMIADLDDHLRSRGPAAASATGHAAAVDSWAQVR